MATAGKRKRGRPRAAVDAALVLKLARLGCTAIEIGDIAGVHADTVTRNFAAQLSKGRSEMRISLRRQLLRVALREKGASAAVLIFCAKAYCQLFEEPAVPQSSVEFIVVPPADPRICCSCIDSTAGPHPGCMICAGSGYLPPTAEA